ncbi:MAG: hypothetical protein J9259_03275 [Thermoplasmata archaeon YP2-bin.285]|uniref:KaiC-like domain-containing protein n=1 Tax=Candidatus Sysuiplasma superficiale TaxID=2823368 RepID=A0A8J8CAW1_9ARCH|nr:hypothetical protein [Candidatus Sysuiplasma superficiale]
MTASVQLCPVCGYALKKSEMQCGRCGEDLSGSRSVKEGSRAQDTGRASRWGGDYTIETIGMGHSAPSYGIREMNYAEVEAPHERDRAEEKQESAAVIEELKRQIEEMNRKMSLLSSQKSFQASASGSTPPPPSSTMPAVSRRRMTGRNDPEFRALVAAHLKRIEEMLNSGHADGHSSGNRHFKFLSESIIAPGVPEDSAILFVGPPGTLKSVSAFVSSVEIAKSTGKSALYVLLNESSRKFMGKLLARGIVSADDMQRTRIVDGAEIRKATTGLNGSWREVLLKYLDMEMKGKAYAVVVLDNLNALSSMVIGERERRVAYDYFEWCRRKSLVSIAIREGSYSTAVREKAADAYLADGVVQFSSRSTESGNTIPVFRVMKLRGAEIDTRYYTIQLASGTLKFVPAVAV